MKYEVTVWHGYDQVKFMEIQFSITTVRGKFREIFLEKIDFFEKKNSAKKIFNNPSLQQEENYANSGLLDNQMAGVAPGSGAAARAQPARAPVVRQPQSQGFTAFSGKESLIWLWG
jgi:hypothetical protein